MPPDEFPHHRRRLKEPADRRLAMLEILLRLKMPHELGRPGNIDILVGERLLDHNRRRRDDAGLGQAAGEVPGKRPRREYRLATVPHRDAHRRRDLEELVSQPAVMPQSAKGCEPRVVHPADTLPGRSRLRGCSPRCAVFAGQQLLDSHDRRVDLALWAVIGVLLGKAAGGLAESFVAHHLAQLSENLLGTRIGTNQPGASVARSPARCAPVPGRSGFAARACPPRAWRWSSRGCR